MKKVLLFGGTGQLGKKIAEELYKQGYVTTAIVRNKNKMSDLSTLISNSIEAEVTKPETLKDICKGQEIIISSLGKSVSLSDKSSYTFRDIDLNANSNILSEAVKSGIKKFVYVSAFEAEKCTHLEYFNVHHEFSERLKSSGLNYSIVKPPAIFSSFLDLIEMGRKGQLMTLGKGDKRTNPIYEGDLAKVCVDSIQKNNVIIEAGGKNIYTRHQINTIIQQSVNPKGSVRNVPGGLLSIGLPVLKLINKNMHDKFAFYWQVMQHDAIAPQIGETSLEDYLKMKVK